MCNTLAVFEFRPLYCSRSSIGTGKSSSLRSWSCNCSMWCSKVAVYIVRRLGALIVDLQGDKSKQFIRCYGRGGLQFLRSEDGFFQSVIPHFTAFCRRTFVAFFDSLGLSYRPLVRVGSNSSRCTSFAHTIDGN